MITSLPRTWVEKPLREVCEPTKLWNQQRNPRAEFWYIDVSAVSRESYAIREPQRIKGTEAPSRARKIVQSGDTIFATVRPTLRRVAFVGPGFNDQIASTAFCVVRANREKASPRFLYYLLLTDFLNEEIAKFESGASYPAVNDKDVLDRAVPLPPKPEQEKIAAVLWKVQRAIEVEEKLIATARELKQSALRQLFTRGLRGELQKETEIGPLPESWEVLPLETTCDFASGGTPSKAHPEFWDGAIPWASPKDMKRPRLRDTQDHISQAGLDAGTTLVPSNSLFVVIRGMILMKDVPVALTEVPMAFNQDIKAILPREQLAPDFLLYAFEAFRHLLFQKVGRSAHGTRTLLSHELAAFLIPVPSVGEQREITGILQTLDSKISVHERKRATLQELFKTLLHQLMTGEIRVHDLDIDVSEVQA